MEEPRRRLPGESNEEHDRKRDPNAEFLGASSLHHGGDPTWSVRLFHALFAWRDRRRARR